LARGDRPPQALLGIGHQAQNQLVGDQPLEQPFGIGKIPLAPAPRTVRLRLRQVQASRRRTGTFPFLDNWLPVSFERGPDRFPVLGRRFHHHFVDLLFDQPVDQLVQAPVCGAKLTPFKFELADNFNVGVDGS